MQVEFRGQVIELARVKRRFLRVDRPLRSWNTYVQGKRNGACVMLPTLKSELNELAWTFGIILSPSPLLTLKKEI